MGDVHVWWSAADAPERAEALLTATERDRLARLARPLDRDALRSAHLLVRLLVAEVTGARPHEVTVVQRCDRCGEGHGRPSVSVAGRTGPPVSLSHAGRLVVAAVASASVGVDVEPLTAADEPVGDVVLSPAERVQLERLPVGGRREALTRWWVRKEAVLKAAGLGLHVDPTQIEVSPPDQPPQVVAWRGAGRPRAVRMADLDLAGDHAAAVAVLTRRSPRVSVAHAPLSDHPW